MGLKAIDCFRKWMKCKASVIDENVHFAVVAFLNDSFIASPFIKNKTTHQLTSPSTVRCRRNASRDVECQFEPCLNVS